MWYKLSDRVDFHEALLLQLHMSCANILGNCTALTVKLCCRVNSMLVLSGFHCAMSSKYGMSEHNERQDMRFGGSNCEDYCLLGCDAV
jgi:hypothetical protein